MDTPLTQDLQAEYEIVVEKLIYGGDGMGRAPDGKMVFIPQVLPGEKVLARTREEKSAHRKADLVKVITPAPRRVTPRCPHFQECGGCHYQHMAYADQLSVKQQIVIDQLTRIGKVTSPPVAPVIPSPREWNYRNTVQFQVSPAGRMGFTGRGNQGVVEIAQCYLPEPAINELWPQLDLEPAANIRRVLVRCGVEDELLAGLECGHDWLPEFELDIPLSAVFLGKSQDVVLSGDPFSWMRVKEVDFRVSARSFFQVNTLQAEAMVAVVLGEIGDVTGKTVLDLYSGVGLFSRFIAPLAGQVIAVELSESACEDFAFNMDAYDNVALYMGEVESILPSLPGDADVVLLDPPRAGLDRAVVEALARSTARKVVYVSCDPTTLARDLRRFIDAGFGLVRVQPLDLFPQTFHIEAVATLERDLSKNLA